MGDLSMAKARKKSNCQQSPQKAAVGPNRCLQVVGLCLALAAITFAVFGQTLRHDFVNFDDEDYVFGNPMVARGLTRQGIGWAFTHVHSANWHPLTSFSHMLDCQLYGLRPGGHHLTNVLLHTAAVLALFLVLRQMTGFLWRSAFVAAVFAIHPLRVESVAWVAERKDVLSGLFFMLTIGAYVRYARRPWAGGCYGLLLLLFAMGLMCKPMLVTLPLVLRLLDYWPLQRTESAGKLWMEKLPLLALSAASCVATIAAQRGFIQTGGSFSLPYRLGNALVACMVYLGQMVWPVGLAVFYPCPRNALPAWEVPLAATLLAGLSALAFGLRRNQPWIWAGWLWYLIMLVPVLGIIQVGGQAHADRYTYLPQIGIYISVAWLAAEWRVSRMALGGLMIGVLGVLMVCAWQQTAYWQNSETLWTHTLAYTTDNNVAELNLGSAFLKKGQLDEAIAHFQKALEIKPDYADAHNNLGKALLQNGQLDEAMAQFQKALDIKPDHAEAHNNLGAALLKKGGVDEAILHDQEALQIRPDFVEAHVNLGNALLQKDRVDEAIAHYQKALEIEPGLAEAHYNLGVALRQRGSVDESITQFHQAMQLKPDDAASYNDLGTALLQKGELGEAISQFKKALAIKPDYADASYNLALSFHKQGRMDEAIAQYQKTLEIKPTHAEAHNNLGDALLQKGRVDEAIAHFQNALEIQPRNAEAHMNLGSIFFQQGRMDEAIAHYQKALEIRPDYAAARENLERINALRNPAK